jgi:hypothetical protein
MRLMTNLLLVALLAGCAAAPPTEKPAPVVITKYARAECGTPPQRQEVNLRPISWRVLDDRFSLSTEGYEDLSYNITVILAGIRELQSEIEFYETCIKNQPGASGVASNPDS